MFHRLPLLTSTIFAIFFIAFMEEKIFLDPTSSFSLMSLVSLFFFKIQLSFIKPNIKEIGKNEDSDTFLINFFHFGKYS